MSIVTFGPDDGPAVFELVAFPLLDGGYRPRLYQVNERGEQSHADRQTRAIGEWIHVMWLYSPPGLLLYIDGLDATSFPSVSPPMVSSGTVSIGDGQRPGFLGRIDDLRVYEGAVWTRDEIGAVVRTPR